MNKTVLKVPEMTCGHCKVAVEGELGKLSGVSAEADPERGVVDVSYDEYRTSEDQIKAAIGEAGYAVAD